MARNRWISESAKGGLELVVGGRAQVVAISVKTATAPQYKQTE